MKRKVEMTSLERVIQSIFHSIADKHKIDVDLVAEIVDEYDTAMSKVVQPHPVFFMN